jgi:hypothetical protein
MIGILQITIINQTIWMNCYMRRMEVSVKWSSLTIKCISTIKRGIIVISRGRDHSNKEKKSDFMRRCDAEWLKLN